MCLFDCKVLYIYRDCYKTQAAAYEQSEKFENMLLKDADTKLYLQKGMTWPRAACPCPRP